MKHLLTATLCILIILLPGCSLLGPWIAGQNANIEEFELELDDLKVAVRQADTNKDGMLGWKEALVGALGLGGASVLRNKLSDKRKQKIEDELRDVKNILAMWEKAAKAPGAQLPPTV